MSEIPIACSLDADAYRARFDWIAQLNREALLSHDRQDLTLRLCYSPSATEMVRRLVAQEQVCCGFMSFRVRETSEGIEVTVTAPEAAREVADVLFGDFVNFDSRRDLSVT